MLKKGHEVGATKRGKGTKIMAISDGVGLPVAVHVASARSHEVTLTKQTVTKYFIVDEDPHV